MSVATSGLLGNHLESVAKRPESLSSIYPVKLDSSSGSLDFQL